jgi:hypothetical protein
MPALGQKLKARNEQMSSGLSPTVGRAEHSSTVEAGSEKEAIRQAAAERLA